MAWDLVTSRVLSRLLRFRSQQSSAEVVGPSCPSRHVVFQATSIDASVSGFDHKRYGIANDVTILQVTHLPKSDPVPTSVPPPGAARTIQTRNTAPPAKLVCGHGSGSHAPKFIGATHAPTSVWVRAGDHSLARLLRKLSSKPAFTASATPGRNPCLRALLGGA